jgi:hypothetical protein
MEQRLLTFYIVFHELLFSENTDSFLTNDKFKTFVWIGVNERIPKTIPLIMKNYPIIYEYKMRLYNPGFQMNHFYQNSVFFHLYRNQSYLTSKFIGFGQYDMKFSRSSIPILEDDHVYGYFPYEINTVWNYFPLDFWKDNFLNIYNEHYGTSHTFEDLIKYPIFLYHTFIIPTSFFLHIMPFIENDTNILLKALNYNTRHIAGSLERVFGLCIACGLAEGRLKKYVIQQGVSHIKEQHSNDPLRGIQKGKFYH